MKVIKDDNLEGFHASHKLDYSVAIVCKTCAILVDFGNVFQGAKTWLEMLMKNITL